jgi:dihydrofolate reductase
VRELKKAQGRNLLVPGSCNVVQTLMANDLVDELHLHIAPVVLGKGKRLFAENAKPRAMKLVRSVISPAGVLLVNYARDGEIKTASFALPS